MKKTLSIGVVVPVHNCLKYTKQTYESFVTHKYRYEWIFIDNGSTDGTEEWIRSLKVGNIYYIKNEENLGVAKSWNLGIRTAFQRGHDVAFVINNDLVFAPDTVDNLMDWYGSEEEGKFEFVTVCSIGPNPDSLKYYSRQKNCAETPQFIGFVVNERTIKRVGYFDEGYEIAYFEDNAFHEELRKEHIAAICCFDAPVSHYGSRTIKEGGVDVEDNKIFVKNRLRFREAYGYFPELGIPDKPKVYDKVQKAKLLWIGDAVANTGFAKVTHNLCVYLQNFFDVHILGINYRGDPHDYPYKIYPAMLGGDGHGVNRLDKLIRDIRPDIICAINDPWIIAKYMGFFKRTYGEKFPFPVVAYIPVDSPNFIFGDLIKDIDAAIFYTQFGLGEAKKTGFEKPSYVIPHGIDTRYFFPVDKMEARTKLGMAKSIPEDAFVFGNVNRNQLRKRQDLCMKYFKEWLDIYKPDRPTYLYLHCAVDDPAGYDLDQLSAYFGIGKQVLLLNRGYTVWSKITEENMHLVYNSFDVHISTTMGEGFGLSTPESMSCKIPNIVPEWSALGEWARGGVYYVPCTDIFVNPGQINTIGGIVDKTQFIEAMQAFYKDEELRKEYGQKGYDLVHEEKYRWYNIAVQFRDAFKEVMDKKYAKLRKAVA